MTYSSGQAHEVSKCVIPSKEGIQTKITIIELIDWIPAGVYPRGGGGGDDKITI